MTKPIQKGKVRFVPRDKKLFFITLKERVDNHFKSEGLSSHANRKMVIKTVALFSMYLLPLAAIVIYQPPFLVSLLLWSIISLGYAGIGMSVMHDANHGAYSGNSKLNSVIAWSINTLGASKHNWKLQHNVLHHTYTNIAHMDDDIDEKLVFRFSPHNPAKPYHRFQYLYAFAFYGIMTLYWVILKDFVQFVKYTKNGVNQKTTSENIVILTKIVAVKVCYFAAFIVLPIWAGIPVWQVIAGFLFMHVIAGIVLTVVFQLAHTVEETSHPLPCEKGIIENEWAIHQLNTTVNFARHNKVLSWYIGGLNFQVEHHLFPRICHVHYPKIAPIVKKTAEEFGVPYLENETFWQAFRSHISVLQRFGKTASLNEAIG
jgi:linoleoyl-CoA desaturase